jgi:hypothetical protein
MVGRIEASSSRINGKGSCLLTVGLFFKISYSLCSLSVLCVSWREMVRKCSTLKESVEAAQN